MLNHVATFFWASKNLYSLKCPIATSGNPPVAELMAGEYYWHQITLSPIWRKIDYQLKETFNNIDPSNRYSADAS